MSCCNSWAFALSLDLIYWRPNVLKWSVLILSACCHMPPLTTGSVSEPSEHRKSLISPSLLTVTDLRLKSSETCCFGGERFLLHNARDNTQTSFSPTLNCCGSMIFPLQTCDTLYLRCCEKVELCPHLNYPIMSVPTSEAVLMCEQCVYMRNTNKLHSLRKWSSCPKLCSFAQNHKCLFLRNKCEKPPQRLHILTSLNIYIFIMTS